MKLPDPAAPGTGLAGILKIESYDAESIVKPFRWYNSPEVRLDALVEKYTTIPPMTALSYKSPLIELAMSGDHYDVKVDPIGLRRLIAWVDAMGPYRGGEEIRSLPDPDFEGIDELAIRPRTKTAPNISRP
jgi:hypothetical protein